MGIDLAQKLEMEKFNFQNPQLLFFLFLSPNLSFIALSSSSSVHEFLLNFYFLGWPFCLDFSKTHTVIPLMLVRISFSTLVSLFGGFQKSRF